MKHTPRQRFGWSAAFVVICVCSLVPVLWIVMLSLKTPATDGSFIPHQWTLSNYSDIFRASSPARCATRSGSR
jgi:multiple sugar transport system permease protein